MSKNLKVKSVGKKIFWIMVLMAMFLILLTVWNNVYGFAHYNLPNNKQAFCLDKGRPYSPNATYSKVEEYTITGNPPTIDPTPGTESNAYKLGLNMQDKYIPLSYILSELSQLSQEELAGDKDGISNSSYQMAIWGLLYDKHNHTFKAKNNDINIMKEGAQIYANAIAYLRFGGEQYNQYNSNPTIKNSNQITITKDGDSTYLGPIKIEYKSYKTPEEIELPGASHGTKKAIGVYGELTSIELLKSDGITTIDRDEHFYKKNSSSFTELGTNDLLLGFPISEKEFYIKLTDPSQAQQIKKIKVTQNSGVRTAEFEIWTGMFTGNYEGKMYGFKDGYVYVTTSGNKYWLTSIGDELVLDKNFLVRTWTRNDSVGYTWDYDGHGKSPTGLSVKNPRCWRRWYWI